MTVQGCVRYSMIFDCYKYSMTKLTTALLLDKTYDQREETPLNVNNTMASKRSLTALSVIVDVAIWVAVTIGAIVLAYNLTELEPVERGFFCDDQTIQFPYKPDTVKDSVVIIISVVMPAIIMFVIEAIHVLTERKSLEKGDKPKILGLVVSLYRVIGIFLAGGTGTILITEVLKLVSGRLRPNFFDVCEPDYKKINCSLGYIMPPSDFCNNTDIKMLLDARKSFPSGHASVSAYGSVFLMIILHRRFVWRQFKLILPLLQGTVFCVGVYISISRVTDNRHHVTDVIGGGVIGVVVALFMILCVLDVTTLQKGEPNKSSYTFSPVTNGTRGEIQEMYTATEIKQRNKMNNTENIIPNV